MNGTDGRLIVPSVGAIPGTMNRWSLTRSEESTPGNPGVLTLRAFFSYLNLAMATDPDVPVDVEITIRRGKHYRVCGERMAFDGMTLVMENCTLCEPRE